MRLAHRGDVELLVPDAVQRDRLPNFEGIDTLTELR